MPTGRSVQKQVRVSQRRRLRNKSARTLCKTNITKTEKLIAANELESAREAAKGSIHPNNAARRKSRLMKKLNKALPAAEAEPEEDV